MADYNLIKIGSIYLTDDGLVTGAPCRTDVPGLASLLQEKTGIIRLAADGTPYPYTMPNEGKGLPIKITAQRMAADVLGDIVDEHNTALSGNATINITIDGDFGSFDLDCYVNPNNGVEAPGTFSSGIIDDVTFNYTIFEVN